MACRSGCTRPAHASCPTRSTVSQARPQTQDQNEEPVLGKGTRQPLLCCPFRYYALPSAACILVYFCRHNRRDARHISSSFLAPAQSYCMSNILPSLRAASRGGSYGCIHMDGCGCVCVRVGGLVGAWNVLVCLNLVQITGMTLQLEITIQTGSRMQNPKVLFLTCSFPTSGSPAHSGLVTLQSTTSSAKKRYASPSPQARSISGGLIRKSQNLEMSFPIQGKRGVDGYESNAEEARHVGVAHMIVLPAHTCRRAPQSPRPFAHHTASFKFAAYTLIPRSLNG
jgi:hypothetical protein